MSFFTKILIGSGTVLVHLVILISFILLIRKYGIDVFFKSIIDKLEYFINRIIFNNIKSLIKFLILELKVILNIFFDKKLEVGYLITILGGIVNIYFTIHSTQSMYSIYNLVILASQMCIMNLLMILKKGNADNFLKSFIDKVDLDDKKSLNILGSFLRDKLESEKKDPNS